MNAAALRGWLETRQIAIYLVATGLGIAVGTMAPATGAPFERAITPVLAALIYTTFLQIAYVVAAPIVGWTMARLFRLDAGAGRALVFSASTRNSLVVLPLALAAPFDGGPVAAVVVTQTLVELLAELAYIKLVPRLVG